jgi:hypothetical protein
MKKVLYYILVPIVFLIGIPFIIIDKEKWNRFGRKFDRFFGIESKHTKNYNSL